MKGFIQKNIIGTQIWVSLMICSLCLFFGMLYQNVDSKRILIVFFSTFAGYNYIHYHASWNKNFFIRGLVSVLLLLLVLFYLLIKEDNWSLFLHLVFLSGFVFMYNSNFLKLKIRNISLLKIFVIAFVWAYSIVWIGNTGTSLKEFACIYFFILGITLPFDICDMKRDAVVTIPKVIGLRNTKVLSGVFLFISGVIFHSVFHTTTIFTYSWCFACLISVILIVFVHNEQFFYTRFWIEACSFLPLLLYILLK